jgi:hypothetical protein
MCLRSAGVNAARALKRAGAPGAIVGEANTKVISPHHIYTLPAAPPSEDEE